MSFSITGPQITTSELILKKNKQKKEHPDEAPSLTRGLTVLESSIGEKKL